MPSSAEGLEVATDLRLAIGRIARRMRQLYAVGDGAGPSFTELAVLDRLRRDGPQTTTEMSNREHVTSQAITAVIGALEAKTLVTRGHDDLDRRRTVVGITDAGRAALADREHTVMGRLVRVLENCSDDEVRQLLAVTPLLNRIADSL
jgi:DNA-binding MarR family transcriptional regulator